MGWNGLPRRRLAEPKRRRKFPNSLILAGLVVVCIVLGYSVVFFSFFSRIPSGPATNEKSSSVPSQSSHVRGKAAQRRDTIARQNPNNQVVEEIPKPVKRPPATPRATIGFAVTITGCGSDPITEGAAVLAHSIRLASIHGDLGGQYDYKLYAIYHPKGASCAASLEPLGYELVERETPVAVKDIEGEFLRRNIEANGCCGEKELVKLEAYTLTDHPVIVHLDLDVLILKPLDELFDWMISGSQRDTVPIMWPDKEPNTKVNAFFTRDYNMVGPGRAYKPVQGGFLVLRPDMNVYNEFVSIIKKGDFRERGGWGGLVGPFYGSMTFQGIIPYYYDVLHPNEAVELNRCVYNQMCDNPKDKPTVNDVTHGRCKTNEIECEDCRNRPLEDVVTAHFTLCQKPWMCLPQDHDMIQQRLCRKLHHEWHRIRADLEQSWGRSLVGQGSYQMDHFYGHCTSHGSKGYVPMEQPYGPTKAISQA